MARRRQEYCIVETDIIGIRETAIGCRSKCELDDAASSTKGRERRESEGEDSWVCLWEVDTEER